MQRGDDLANDGISPLVDVYEIRREFVAVSESVAPDGIDAQQEPKVLLHERAATVVAPGMRAYERSS